MSGEVIPFAKVRRERERREANERRRAARIERAEAGFRLVYGDDPDDWPRPAA